MRNTILSPIVVADVSPLWELQYTGISNVVYELTRRLLTEESFEVQFTAMGKLVPIEVIAQSVSERNGSSLQSAFNHGSLKDLVVDARKRLNGRSTIGLFTNTKPAHKVYCADTQIYYDFSPLLTPECHTTDTVRHHMEGLIQQINSCDHMICISESTAKDLEWIFDVPRSRIHVCLLGNNVDLRASDQVKHRLGNTPVEPYFLILGTVEPRKNIELVLRWLVERPEVAASHRVVLAGREGWGPTFRELADRAGATQLLESGRIKHVGYVDEIAKAALLVGARALIFPSLFEGFGLPVLEAMAVGTMVISSCSTSLPEVLGDCGYYFDPESTNSLHRAYLQFLGDTESGHAGQKRRLATDRASTFSYDETYARISKVLLRTIEAIQGAVITSVHGKRLSSS